MLLIFIGTLLFISGMVLMVTQTIGQTGPSNAGQSPAAAGPLPRRGRRLGVKASLPGLALVVLGSLLLLSAVF